MTHWCDKSKADLFQNDVFDTHSLNNLFRKYLYIETVFATANRNTKK